MEREPQERGGSPPARDAWRSTLLGSGSHERRVRRERASTRMQLQIQLPDAGHRVRGTYAREREAGATRRGTQPAAG
eukprot:14945469-Alexandrium_andersonii.AAC.1